MTEELDDQHAVGGIDPHKHTATVSLVDVRGALHEVVKARGHFPTEQAALKCLYLVTRSLDPTGKGRARCAMRWKPALDAFAIAFPGRIVPSTTN